MHRHVALAIVCTALQAWATVHASDATPTPDTHWQSDTPAVFVEGARLHYYGRMNAAGADSLRTTLSRTVDVHELHIASPGGDVLASVDIGEQIKARDLAVVVVGKGCASGCAHYVFTPARRRTISPESLVLWHYSCPATFPDRRGQVRRALRRQFGKPSFGYSAEEDGRTIEDPTRLRENFEQNLDRLVDAHLEFVQAYRAGHDRLFASTGIDSRIVCMVDQVRLPKVPEEHVSFLYTLSPGDMARFGVCDVEARSDYADWAARELADDEDTRRYTGVLRLSDYPRFRPRPTRTCSAG